MRGKTILLVLAALLVGPAAPGGGAGAQEKPTVAMIGTGNLGGTLGPALGRAGYPVIYGSRDPARDTVRTLVQRTGTAASATTPAEAAARADIVVLAVPGEVVHEVMADLGDLGDRIIVDVSSGDKRIAEDGYLELVSDSTNAEEMQARHRTVRMVRINLPFIGFFIEPTLVGTRPTVLIAGDDPRAREAVAQFIFDVGLDPWDAGPLRFSRVFDALGALSLIPLQQGRAEGYELKLIPSAPLSCFVPPPAIPELFGFGRPYDLDRLPQFPSRATPVPCEEWRRRLGM